MIRRATMDDVDPIARIYVDARDGAMPWLPWAHPRADVPRFVREQMIQQEVWVSEVGGAVVAYAARDGDELSHLYVDPAHQGRGHGDALLEQVAARADEPLELWAFARNAPARGFYERRGFVVEYETDGSGNAEREPDVRYVRRR